MTPEQQSTIQQFSNSIAQLLVKAGVINFKMDLVKKDVKADFDQDKLDTAKLESMMYEIDDITETH